MQSGDQGRRGTVWFGSQGLQSDLSAQATDQAIRFTRRATTASQDRIPVAEKSPWDKYEARAVYIVPGRQVTLAQHKRDKSNLVNIEQRSLDLPQAQSLIQTIAQYSNRRYFLNLLDVFHHERQCFLVWESVQLSLGKVLLSQCPVTEQELAQIVWPILRGIMTLHDHGRALATLKEDDVFLTEAGSVRIAGIENSCAIEKAQMNANTLKQTALAEIVKGLLQNNKSETPWSSNARELPDRLIKQPLAKLLHLTDQDPIFEKLEGDGSLQMLVNIANKTAYHRITVLNCPPRE